jgi:FixJ family two-component response regulator
MTAMAVPLKSNVASRRLPLSQDVPKRAVHRSIMDILPTRVAILDDDQSVRTAISRLLKASQMETECFASYLELLNFLERGAIDCLVLDLQMPGLNGIDVMRYLDQRGVSLPIVMITAHDGPGARERCLSAGAMAYVRKPLDADALLDAIHAAMTTGISPH